MNQHLSPFLAYDHIDSMREDARRNRRIAEARAGSTQPRRGLRQTIAAFVQPISVRRPSHIEARHGVATSR